jgi:hypothetical protein
MRSAYFMTGIAALVIIAGVVYGVSRTAPRSYTEQPMVASGLSLASTAFEDGGLIPAAYTCDGSRELSPSLSISGIPAGAKSLVLIVDDPDVPKERVPSGVFDHWILFNIPTDVREIPEGGTAGVAGVNTSGKNAYTGPCPPKEYQPSEHRYFFKLYALDTELALEAGATKAAVEQAMGGHVLAETQLMARYERP